MGKRTKVIRKQQEAESDVVEQLKNRIAELEQQIEDLEMEIDVLRDDHERFSAENEF